MNCEPIKRARMLRPSEPSGPCERIKIPDAPPAQLSNKVSAWVLGGFFGAWYVFGVGRCLGVW